VGGSAPVRPSDNHVLDGCRNKEDDEKYVVKVHLTNEDFFQASRISFFSTFAIQRIIMGFVCTEEITTKFKVSHPSVCWPRMYAETIDIFGWRR
jgi:hypothetical protein